MEAAAESTGGGFRPRVFLGSTLINKNPTGEYTWSPTADTWGDIVEDINGGCVGGRWAILNSIADWREEDGERRTHLVPWDLYIARGMSLSNDNFLPRFTATSQGEREMPPMGVAEIHVDYAKIHLYSGDWNTPDSEKKGDLAD